MKQFLLYFSLAVGLFGATAALAQQKENHTLLWRISGNGLTEDSYLYGTMHLQDERVYDFSDSVLLKLDHCKAFAMEVNPDSIVYYLFKDMVRPGQIKKKLVKETLSPEDYRTLAGKFKEKTGFELDQINQLLPVINNAQKMANKNAQFLGTSVHSFG